MHPLERIVPIARTDLNRDVMGCREEVGYPVVGHLRFGQPGHSVQGYD